MEQPLTTLLRKEPPPEGKPWNKADNFCRRKFCEQNFMQARGSREAADNFCRKNEGTEFFSGKGKPWKDEEIRIDLYRLLTQTLSPLP